MMLAQTAETTDITITEKDENRSFIKTAHQTVKHRHGENPV